MSDQGNIAQCYVMDMYSCKPILWYSTESSLIRHTHWWVFPQRWPLTIYFPSSKTQVFGSEHRGLSHLGSTPGLGAQWAELFLIREITELFSTLAGHCRERLDGHCNTTWQQEAQHRPQPQGSNVTMFVRRVPVCVCVCALGASKMAIKMDSAVHENVHNCCRF